MKGEASTAVCPPCHHPAGVEAVLLFNILAVVWRTASVSKTGKSTDLWQKKVTLGYGHPIAALFQFLSPLQVTFPPLPRGWHWQQGDPRTGEDTCQPSHGRGEGTHDGCLLLQHPALGSLQTARGHLEPDVAEATSSPVVSQHFTANSAKHSRLW